MSLVLWAVAAFSFTSLIENDGGADIRRALLNFALAMTCYYAVLAGTVNGEWVMQTLTTLIGCGALMALCITATLVTIGQLDVAEIIRMLAIAYLISS